MQRPQYAGRIQTLQGHRRCMGLGRGTFSNAGGRRLPHGRGAWRFYLLYVGGEVFWKKTKKGTGDEQE